MTVLDETRRPKLSGKIRKVIHPQKVVKASENLRFYTKYAALVSKALRKPRFQTFLKWMLRREKIEEHRIKDIQIKTFPSVNKNGHGLAGKCNSRGQIRIYPKRLEFCQKQMQEFGKKNVKFYIKGRAKAALIHELLHLKYASDEKKVRELTKKYFNIFTKHQHTQNSNMHDTARMSFT
jgi:hypothetical protein